MKGIVKLSFLNSLLGLTVEEAQEKMNAAGNKGTFVVQDNKVVRVLSEDFVEEDIPRELGWADSHWISL